MENSGLIPLIQQDKLEDLGRMYTLFRRVDGGAELMRQVGSRMLACACTCVHMHMCRTSDLSGSCAAAVG